MDERRAAIDLDGMMDRPLGELSAADFMQVLAHPRVVAHASILADKKKYELWVEEGVITKIPLGEVLKKIRVEKKKAELEIPDRWRWRVNPADAIRPEYSQLVEDVARLVEERLGPR